MISPKIVQHCNFQDFKQIMTVTQTNTIEFKHLNLRDLDIVGGKNSSLGEMIQNLSSQNILVPAGFATTAAAFREFIAQNGLDRRIYQKLADLDVNDVRKLAQIGQDIRAEIIDTTFTEKFIADVHKAYEELQLSIGHQDFTVAVRSSATAEDLPDASFAGQQETFLNVKGIEAILQAIKAVFASLFNDRAISYRVHNNFAHQDIAISAGIQQMVRSDLGASGVIFTIDTESGFSDVVLITSSYGLGEMVVQGAVNPDEFYVHKPTLEQGFAAVIQKNLGSKLNKMIYCAEKDVQTVTVDARDRTQFSLSNTEILELARYAVTIEKHYQRPMDIEWAKDGITEKLYILQARPETVKSRHSMQVLERYILNETGKILAEGRSIGQRIGQGKVRIIKNLSEIHKVMPGDVLVSEMTDPDWEPVMKRASAIVTNRGGRTCHAAIIARELGIPAVVGCGNAMQNLRDDENVTVNCAHGDTGFIYEGLLAFEKISLNINNMPKLPVKIMLNVGNPQRAFAFQAVPNAGVGLARIEFLITNSIGIHPRALLDYDKLEDLALKTAIADKISAFTSAREFYIERLKEGVATIAAAFYPKPVIVRLSDFKSNEYANLLGGSLYEPIEENPMLGFRGASRYTSENFKEAFALECIALKRVREDMGLSNVEIMVPFVRTVNEAKNVLEALKMHGLERGKNGLRIIMMCELPSNALLAKQFLEHFDGFSVGSNDLTQLTLGLDRDSGLVAKQFDERDEAVKTLLHMAIQACKTANKYIGICGQGPSDHKDFAAWLVQEGIESMSLNPDSVLDTCLFLAEKQ
jgi:pyruvate, water dikinase